jgi:ketosteroid isomerase-like protein
MDEVIGNFAKSFELTGGNFSVEIHDVLANDEHGVVLATVRAERDGKKLEDTYTHVVHFRDGKVAESWIHQWDQYATDELFA